ncbi:proteasome core particle subunit beta 3 [Puccinia graminis f. sp. tritici]|uniref:Proteasome core particle subunit beta 3 n=1 Tax=Puccinia graminis f. sp. tritici TaxID=56615 RepID=A0A5B0NR99_PUCGR|nr:proteasome core particle subunit beta 3 [Puccinia graminis f. sp. tritici]
MSIMELNGGSVVAMVGKGCVAIACDLRLGNQALTVACNFEKVFQVTDKMFIGLPGLATDTFTFFAKDFVVSGTASSKLFGMAEALWEPDLAPEDLFETISQTLLNAVDRDAYSGWGAVVWIIEADQVTKRVLKSRMD